MELNEYLSILRRYWRVVAVTGILGALLGGVLGSALRGDPPVPEYTASARAVVLTPDARRNLEAELDALRSFSSTARVFLDISSPNNQVSTNDDYTKSRIPTFISIVTSDAVLAPLAEQAGVGLESFLERVEIDVQPDSTVIDLTVADPDRTLAIDLTQQLNSVLQSTVRELEEGQVRFEDFGVRIVEPEIFIDSSSDRLRMEREALARRLLEADPAASASGSEPILALFDNSDVRRLIDELGLPTTTDELRSRLQMRVDDLPFTTETVTEQASDASTSQNGSLAFSITDPDRDQSLAIVEKAMMLLQAKVNERYGIVDGESSPLLITNIGVIQDSTTTSSTTTPEDRTLTNVILGLLIGLAIGVGYALFRSSQDTTIRTVRQLVDLTGLPPFGVIDFNPQATADPWIELDETAPAAEGYRVLRSNLIFGAPQARVLALTSPSPEGGTHTVGINLAIALTQAGRSVCVVEAALRNPCLATVLDLQTAPGLTDVLNRHVELEAALQSWKPGNLQVLTCGAPANNPSELLTSATMATLLDTLRARFNYVICLTTVAQESTDPAVVGRRSDGVLLVLRHNSTTSTQLEAAASSLIQVGAPIIGTVLNDVPAKESLRWRVLIAPEESDEASRDSHG